MPVQYRGVLEEHGAVRSSAGIFDVSHLGRFQVEGAGAVDLVRGQLCNDITRIEPGRAQYTMALNEQGGVEDDIIVWYLDDERLWVMPNGTNSDEIVERFRDAAPDGVSITDLRPSTALFAVQGPDAPAILEAVYGVAPARFRVTSSVHDGVVVVLAGTGYTGERGGEVCVPAAEATDVWNALVDAGAEPCGLGARDTLRLEMGYPLWGHDLDSTTTPLEAGLGWVVAWDHEFNGRAALEASADATRRALVAFTVEGRAIPRHGYPVHTTSGTGTVTSGNFSPTLGRGIGLAYVAPPPSAGETITVEIRGREVPARLVDLPFLDR
jgi:aminomethyltransferase